MKFKQYIFLTLLSFALLSGCSSSTSDIEQNTETIEQQTENSSPVSEISETSSQEQMSDVSENNISSSDEETSPDPSANEITTNIPTNASISNNNFIETDISYDKLQQLYFDIDSSMSYENVLNVVTESQLFYTNQDYLRAKTIKVAFTQNTSLQKYADTGDYVKINFQMNDSNNYVLSSIEYFNNEKFISAFQYISGDYLEFHDSKYQGYYIDDFQTKNGFEITYNNGNKITTNYIVMENKEAQLLYIHNY